MLENIKVKGSYKGDFKIISEKGEDGLITVYAVFSNKQKVFQCVCSSEKDFEITKKYLMRSPEKLNFGDI